MNTERGIHVCSPAGSTRGSPGQIRTRPTSGAVVVFSSCLHSNGCKSASRPNVVHVLS